MVVPYTPNADNVLTPHIPLTGPCYKKDGQPCKIGVHHLRDRKTGPCLALTVIKCHTHKKHFTLYPPGYTPNGRKPVAPVATDGSRLCCEEQPKAAVKDNSDGARKVSAYRNTFFDAALDADGAVAWPRPNGIGMDRYWSTQCRHLEAATQLFGIGEDQKARDREFLADIMDISKIYLHAQYREVKKLPGYKSRGKAVCNILAGIAEGPCELDKILVCGYYAGLWGKPYRWDPEIKYLKSLPYIDRIKNHKTKDG